MCTDESRQKVKPHHWHQSSLGQMNWFEFFKSESFLQTFKSELLQNMVGSLKTCLNYQKIQLPKISEFWDQTSSSSFLLLPPTSCCLMEVPSESLQ